MNTMPARALQCETYDARNERCVGPLNHPGSHHAEDGVWELPKLETPNATAALAVLNKNRRTGVPPPPRPVSAAKKEDPPSILTETQKIRQTIASVLSPPFMYPTAQQAVQALVAHCAELKARVTELEGPQEETYTASFLRKCLNLSDDVILQVEISGYDEDMGGTLITLDDHDQVLRAKRYKR